MVPYYDYGVDLAIYLQKLVILWNSGIQVR